MYSDGIRIDGGDHAGLEFVFAVVSGNVIFFPTRHAISIEGPSSHIAISGNTGRLGSLSSFYGTGTQPQADYVSAESTTKNITVAAENNWSTGSGSPRVITRGTASHDRAGASGELNVDATSVPASAYNWGAVQLNSAYPGGARRQSSLTADSNLVYGADLRPGTFTPLTVMTGPDIGIYTLQVNGVDVGTFDGYAAAEASAYAVLPTFQVKVGGLTTVAIVMKTKNPSSSGYRGHLSKLGVRRTAPPA